MKKTSVEQLTRSVGIAKGSFYKLYESKEMLFFVVLESIHSELYTVADRALNEDGSLPPSQRAAKAILAVCKRLSDTGDMVFVENDAKFLLQRLPESVKNEHYHDEEAHIRELLQSSSLRPQQRHQLGRRRNTRIDPYGIPQGADRRVVPAGAENPGVRHL